MITAVPPARRGPWILAVDVGSSSVRAQWMDASCAPLADAMREPYAWDATPDGGMQLDAEPLLARCIRVIDRAVAAGREAGIEPAAVALATFWHGLVGMDADGRPLTALSGWGDARARQAVEVLRARLDAGEVHGRTGCFLHEAYPAARLVWLRGVAGDSFPRASWGSIGELLVARLFGQARTSASMASGTGLMDLRRMAWDAALLDAVGVGADRLPVIGDEPLRGLRPEFAERWPELARVPWFAALGDGACASLGMGAVGPSVGLTVGTSAAVRVLRDDAEAIVPDGLWCYRLDERRTVCGRATSNGGNVFAWLRRTLALPPADELEAQLSAMPPMGHGLTVIPRLLAERPPRSSGPATASMAGMTAATGPVEIARAWLEAAAFSIADALDAVEGQAGRAAEVVAGGGALHASPAWARMVADALGRPLRLAPDPETTLRGAALLALERLGVIGDALEFAAGERDGAVLLPDLEAHEVYRVARFGGSG